MAKEFYTYTVNRATGERFLNGEPAHVSDCNEAYFLGQISESYFCKRNRKNVTIKGRSIMREEDYTETVIDSFTGMEDL